MHWPIAEELLRPLLPSSLTIDTFAGSAWIGIIPFTMWDIRAFPPLVPALPKLNSVHELNVRTYVHVGNVPGVWFLSLDANNLAAVMMARGLFFLPYYNAEIKLRQEDRGIRYSLTCKGEGQVNFFAAWEIGESLPYSVKDSLEFFLTERYCLYSEYKGVIYRGQVHHEPWSLRRASLSSFSSTMIESHGLPTPTTDPHLLYAEEVSTSIYRLRKTE